MRKLLASGMMVCLILLSGCAADAGVNTDAELSEETQEETDSSKEWVYTTGVIVKETQEETETSASEALQTETETQAPVNVESESEQESLAGIAGEWQLDGAKTGENLKNYASLQEMFGTGIKEGASLKIDEQGMLEYYIGIGRGGTGQCESAKDGLTVEITPYEPHSEEPETLTLRVAQEADQTWLIMKLDGEDLYWKK